MLTPDHRFDRHTVAVEPVSVFPTQLALEDSCPPCDRSSPHFGLPGHVGGGRPIIEGIVLLDEPADQT
jgi:hypothetical protein